MLPESARTVFRLRSGPSGRVVGLGRPPFICQEMLARIVERVLPPDILLVHYLDDFLLLHHDKGYIRDNTGNTVIALGHEGFIVSPKSVLEPATQLGFLGKWLDLVQRMVWSHEVAHLQMFVAWLRLPVWRSHPNSIHMDWSRATGARKGSAATVCRTTRDYRTATGVCPNRSSLSQQ